MSFSLLLISAVLILCVLGTKLAEKTGLPSLILFIFIGMLAGSDGLLGIEFGDYAATEAICSAALIFIMFYGGFGTKWEAAKPVAKSAILLSSLGTIATALLTAAFCHLALGMSMLNAFLIGSVISSTDAASVFSILKSKKLSLKYNTDSLLEIESGSNDPFAYMLTTIALSAMESGAVSAGRIIIDIILQIGIGALFGFLTAFASIWLLRKLRLAEGFSAVLIVAVAILTYAVTSLCRGNGYLAAYIAGIMLGNADMTGRRQLVSFFSGLDSIMQILIFFLLGLLAFPHQIISNAPVAIAIFLFMTIIARPVSVFLIMKPAHATMMQMMTIAWAGLRGASAIVFAIAAAVNPAYLNTDIVNIVFMIVIISIVIQGSLLPAVARKTRMIDETGNVMKTFSDYNDKDQIQFVNFPVTKDSQWSGKAIKDAVFPEGFIVASIERGSGTLLPRGNTVIEAGDTLILGMRDTSDRHKANFEEFTIGRGHSWLGKKLKDVKTDALILLITRNGKDIIPNGETIFMKGDDVLTVSEQKEIRH